MKTARITLRPGFFRFVYTVFLVFGHKKNARNCLKFGRFVYIFVYKFRKSLKINVYCGERGIRTPGTSQYVGFQDRCNRPLCHLSKRWDSRYDFPIPLVRPQGLEPWTH